MLLKKVDGLAPPKIEMPSEGNGRHTIVNKFNSTVNLINQTQNQQVEFYAWLFQEIENHTRKTIERAFFYIYSDTVEWPSVFFDILDYFSIPKFSKRHVITKLQSAFFIHKYLLIFNKIIDYFEEEQYKESMANK